MVNWTDYVKKYRTEKGKKGKKLTLEEAKKEAQKPFEKEKMKEQKEKKEKEIKKLKETKEKVGKILKKKGKVGKKEQQERQKLIKEKAKIEQKKQKELIDNVRKLEKTANKLKSTNPTTQKKIKNIQNKLLDFFKKVVNKSVSNKVMENNIKKIVDTLDKLNNEISVDKAFDDMEKKQKKKVDDDKKKVEEDKKKLEEKKSTFKIDDDLVSGFLDNIKPKKELIKDLQKQRKLLKTNKDKKEFIKFENMFNDLKKNHKYKNSSYQKLIKDIKTSNEYMNELKKEKENEEEPTQNITMEISGSGFGGSEYPNDKKYKKRKDEGINPRYFDWNYTEKSLKYIDNCIQITLSLENMDKNRMLLTDFYKNKDCSDKKGYGLKKMKEFMNYIMENKEKLRKKYKDKSFLDINLNTTIFLNPEFSEGDKLIEYYKKIGFTNVENKNREMEQKLGKVIGGSELEGGFLSDEELAKREKIKADLMKKKDEEQKELFLKAEKEEEELNKKLKEMKKLKSMSKTERKKYEIKQRKKLREKQKKEKAELLIKNREERKKRIEENKQKRIEAKKQKEIDKKEKKKTQKDEKIRKVLEIKDKDDFNEKAFIPQTKKKKPIPMIDIKHAIKQKKDCIKGYKKIKEMEDLKNFVKQTNIYESEFGKKLQKAKNLLQSKKVIEMYNVKYCPPLTKMKRPEVEKVANNLGIITDEKDPNYINLRGIAPRRSGKNVFKPLEKLTGVKKYYNEKEQKEFEEKLEKQKDPFEVDIIKTDKLGNKTSEFDKLSLRDNQKEFIKKMIYSNSRGSIAFWGVGTGKTILGVMTIKLYLNYYPNGRVLFVAPSGLLSNLVEKLYLFGLDIQDRRIEYYSFERYSRIKKGCVNTLLMVDEAHNLRTEIGVKTIKDKEGKDKQKITGGRAKAIIDYCSNVASKVLLLTATPLINKPYDMENLLAMIDGRPEMKQDFFNEILSNKDLLIDYFKNRVSWYSRSENDKDYPKKNQQFLVDYMTQKDADTFTEVQKSADPSVKAYYSGQRVFINKIGENKKIRMVVDKIKKQPKSQNVIYMAFVEKGIYKLSDILNKADIKFNIVSGEEGASEKQQAVENYNNGLISTLIISRAGAEGLDLKNTTNLFVMDMTWNEATREQVIGRGIRYKSHISLPEKDRNVNVYNVFLLKPEEKALMKKVENIKNDKEFSLLLNAYRDKMAEAKANEKGSKKSGREKALRWGNTADILEAKKQGIKIQDYLENVVGDKYTKDQKEAKSFNPPLNISIDLYLYIYSKSKQFVINEFMDFMFKKIPRFEKGVSNVEKIILERIEKENADTRDKRLKIYEEVLDKYVSVGDKILTENNEMSKEVLRKIAEMNNPTPKDTNKYLYKVKEQYVIDKSDIENLYKLSNIDNDKRDNLLFLDGSAGNGNILSHFFNKRKDLEIRGCENDENNVNKIKKWVESIGLSPEEVLSNENNFLRYDTGERYDYICMNPPFKLEKDNENYSQNILDIDMIRKAFTLLKKGGVLSCVIYQKHLKTTIPNKRNKMLKDWIMSHKDSITNKTIKLQDTTPYAKFFTKTEYQKLGISFVKITKNGYNEDNEIIKDIKSLLPPLPSKEVPEFNNEPHLIEVEKDNKKDPFTMDFGGGFGNLITHNTINSDLEKHIDDYDKEDKIKKPKPITYDSENQKNQEYNMTDDLDSISGGEENLALKGKGYYQADDHEIGDRKEDREKINPDYIKIISNEPNLLEYEYIDDCIRLEFHYGKIWDTKTKDEWNLYIAEFYKNYSNSCGNNYGAIKMGQLLEYLVSENSKVNKISVEEEMPPIKRDTKITLMTEHHPDAYIVKYYQNLGFKTYNRDYDPQEQDTDEEDNSESDDENPSGMGTYYMKSQVGKVINTIEMNKELPNFGMSKTSSGEDYKEFSDSDTDSDYGGSENFLIGGTYYSKYDKPYPNPQDPDLNLKKEGFNMKNVSLLSANELNATGKERSSGGGNYKNWLVYLDKCVKIETTVQTFKETKKKGEIIPPQKPSIYLLEFYKNQDEMECRVSDSYGIKVLNKFLKYMLDNKDKLIVKGMKDRENPQPVDIDMSTRIHLRTEIKPPPAIINYYYSLGFRVYKVDRTNLKNAWKGDNSEKGKQYQKFAKRMKKGMTAQEYEENFDTHRSLIPNQVFMEGNVGDIMKGIDNKIKFEAPKQHKKRIDRINSINKGVMVDLDNLKYFKEKYGVPYIGFWEWDNDKKEGGEGNRPKEQYYLSYTESYKNWKEKWDNFKKPHKLVEFISGENEEVRKDMKRYGEGSYSHLLDPTTAKLLTPELNKKMEEHKPHHTKEHINHMTKILFNQLNNEDMEVNWDEAHSKANEDLKPFVNPETTEEEKGDNIDLIGGSEKEMNEYDFKKNITQPEFTGELNLPYNYEESCVDNVIINEILGLVDNVLITGTEIDHLVNAMIVRHNKLNDSDLDITILNKGKGKLYPHTIPHSDNKTISIHNEMRPMDKYIKKVMKFNNFDTIIADCDINEDILYYLRILNQSRAKGIKFLYLINGNLKLDNTFKIQDILKQMNPSNILKNMNVKETDEDTRELLGFEKGEKIGSCGNRNIYCIEIETPQYPDDDIENIIADYNKINTNKFNDNDLQGRGFFGNIKKTAYNRFKQLKSNASGLKEKLIQGREYLSEKGAKLMIKSPRAIQDSFGIHFETHIKQKDDIYYYITEQSYNTTKKSQIYNFKYDNEVSNENVCCYENGNEVIIGYRGSAVIKDFLTDINLARGDLVNDEDFKDRLRMTETIMNKYGNNNKYSLCGHSLGGKIAVEIGKIHKNMYVCVFDMGQGIDISPTENINGVAYSYYGDIVSCLSVVKYNNVIIIKQPNKEKLSFLEAHKLSNFEPPREESDIEGGKFKELHHNHTNNKHIKIQKSNHPLF